MANRPVFKAIENTPYVVKENIEFLYHNGFSLAQKQRSVDSLHESYRARFPDDRILEISTKSRDMIGTRLSAFNLIVNEKNGQRYSVEQLFQAGKVFERGGPYTDLLSKSSREAKKTVDYKIVGN